VKFLGRSTASFELGRHETVIVQMQHGCLFPHRRVPKEGAATENLHMTREVAALPDTVGLISLRDLGRAHAGMPRTWSAPARERKAGSDHASSAAAERDSWARVKTGMYKDDLARVIDVDYSTGRATIEVLCNVSIDQLQTMLAMG